MSPARAFGRLRRTSLLVRFGVASALLVVGLGLVLGRVLTSTVEDRALTQSEKTAVSVGRLAVQPLLERRDFTSGRIGEQRLDRLAAAMETVVADGTVVRVKIFADDGTVLYSDDADIVGQRFEPEGGLAAALEGWVDSELEFGESEENESEAALGDLLEVYVPVHMAGADGADEIVGAFEVYLPYAPVAEGAAKDVQRLAVWLAGGLLVLWLGLFQLMVSASRRLRQHADENERLARHDALTGLPNRSLFADRVQQAVLGAKRTSTGAAVLLADLDRFKEVNDTLGHHIGDKLIAAVGERLGAQLREVDTVARLGGDEFAVLLPQVTGVQGALDAADRLVMSLRTPFVVDGVTLEVGASVGVACFPEHGPDAARLLQCADVAMYAAKGEHLSVMAYASELDANTPSRLALYGELRRAIEEDQLALHYQPQVDLLSRRVTGVEALVRWQHPQRGLLQPDEFIPVAEQTGLIRQMTLCVLRMALRECSAWRTAGHDLTVAVNLSVRSLLDEGLAGEIAQLLDDLRLPAAALELEITETSAMVDPARALAVLAGLRALGVGLSVDDYGTGHSSLAYLNKLPVDTLKIDRSFVSAMDENAQDATIVRSTIDLARNLGLRVVAEGVETEAAWQQLADLGCDAAQGFWLARPAPPEQILALIEGLGERLDSDRGGVTVPG